MISNDHILISLNSCHARKIYDGTKKVELRRRAMHVKPGTIMWIYEKLPVGAITGFATVRAINLAAPELLWKRFGLVAGISELEFFEYFSKIENGCALELNEITQLNFSLELHKLRELKKTFQPPQFFTRLSKANPLFESLNSYKQLHDHDNKEMGLHPVLLVA